MNKEITNNNDKELRLNPQGFVTLPFNENDFKEFVVGLLGKPQTIDNLIEEPFIVNSDDIRNIYSLLNQRIVQQNEATLIQFNSRILFSDNSSVLLNTIEELISYNEIKATISTEVHLTFQYLIKFKDKRVPEKQEINISFVSSKFMKSLKKSSFIDIVLPFQLLTNHIPRKLDGYIQYSIKHTARTWGTDIENLLSNHFSVLLQKDTKFRSFIIKNITFLGIILFFGIIGLGIYFSLKVQDNLIIKNTHLIENAFRKGKQNINTLSEQIKFVSLNKLSDSSSYVSTMMAVSIFLAIFGTILGDVAISKRKDSFVILTRESERNKVKKEKDYEGTWVKFFVSIFVSIGCSILANYLFIYFTQ